MVDEAIAREREEAEATKRREAERLGAKAEGERVARDEARRCDEVARIFLGTMREAGNPGCERAYRQGAKWGGFGSARCTGWLIARDIISGGYHEATTVQHDPGLFITMSGELYEHFGQRELSRGLRLHDECEPSHRSSADLAFCFAQCMAQHGVAP